MPDPVQVDEAEVLEQIRRIAATDLGVRIAVTPETSLTGGLKLDSLSAITARLVALYAGPVSTLAWRPAQEDTLMISPSFLARMPGITAWQQ